MANVYDLAYALENGIRNHEDYLALKKAYEAVNADPVSIQQFQQFRETQMKFQTMQMMGQEIPSEELEAAQQTLTFAQQNPLIRELMDAEQRFSIIIQDISKIFMKPLEEIYGNQY